MVRKDPSALQLTFPSGRVFEGRLVQGTVIRRSARSFLVHRGRIVGRHLARHWIPCILEGPSGVLTMTSGQPRGSGLFDGIYDLDRDLLLRLRGENVRLDGNRVEVSGDRCAIEVLPKYYERSFNPYFRRFNKRQFPRPPVGWLSWYCYFNDFDEEKALATADFAERLLKPYGFEYVLLETWQSNSDALPCSQYHSNLQPDPRKFPHGLRFVAEALHGKGLKAGLWVIVLGTGERAFFETHREMFLVDARGKPMSNWCGRYVLDPTHPKARRYIARAARTFVRDWGFDYLKVDGMEIGTEYSQEFLERPSVQRAMAHRDPDAARHVFELIRKSMGRKTFFLACGAQVTDHSRCPGLPEAARIGKDIFYEGGNPGWRSVLKCAKVTSSAYHVHNIAWYNDPDVLSIRRPLSEAHARMLCTIVGLTGQVLFLSDILGELPARRVWMLQRLMPVCDTYPAYLARSKVLQPVWNHVIRRPFEQWNVVAFFNWNEMEDTVIDVDLPRLGLDADAQFLVYDFWSDRFAGTCRASLSVPLKKQSCKLFAIRRLLGRPQILSVNRHITQGGVCIESMGWDEGSGTLSASMALPPTEKFVATVFAPNGFELQRATGSAEFQGLKRVRGGTLLKLGVRNGPWSCAFRRPAAT